FTRSAEFEAGADPPQGPAGLVGHTYTPRGGIELLQTAFCPEQRGKDGPRKQPVENEEFGSIFVTGRPPVGAEKRLVGAARPHQVGPRGPGGAGPCGD